MKINFLITWWTIDSYFDASSDSVKTLKETVVPNYIESLKTENEQQNIRVVNRIIGLPTELYPSPMPDNMIHGPGGKSNVILVKKSYVFW